MLVFGTQMHLVTFIFVSIEIVIFFYLSIYKLARPDDEASSLNIILISLLIVYNVTGGLLPDPKLPGSPFIQEVIAYATGFITPCYFPYYVYKVFGLQKMKFHAYYGVFLFLMFPYFMFVLAYAISQKLEVAKNLLALPVLYAVWVIISLHRSIKNKYGKHYSRRKFNEESTVLLLSITPWIGLPVIDYFNLGQAEEALITNGGFLLLLALHVKNHIVQIRTEHQGLIESELKLLNWNRNLQKEVDKRTKELQKIHDQKTNTFVNLAHETKTPLTLINNYLEEYINTKGNSKELTIVKKNIDKLSTDIVNFFDLEKFNKGFSVYDHDQISDFSAILQDNIELFNVYSKKRAIELDVNIENNILIKADPVSINRIINNLIENAIKFSDEKCVIEICLETKEEKIIFSVKDCGCGIPPEMHKKIFEPYFQITSHEKCIQGMGLGLPIVKKIIDDLHGVISIKSNPKNEVGTLITIRLPKYEKLENETPINKTDTKPTVTDYEDIYLSEDAYNPNRQIILIIEDNISMANYLFKKLEEKYNVYAALNGKEALKKIKELPVPPDLIISDVMMDKIDGFSFAKIISGDEVYNHIPIIFLSAKSGKEDKLQGLRLGAIDFIQKPFAISELLQKVESVLINKHKYSHAILQSAFSKFNSRSYGKVKTSEENFNYICEQFKLTSREKDIAKLICNGQTYKAIGSSLFISERTVSKHIQNIFEKFEVSNRIELINKLVA
jgi:signal transduction histidine kinase/DNA-binding NarL/FixJ family response regulator